MLSIKDLEVSVENTKILRGINLQVNPGEVHAIMGPNGSGKSTLANVLAGREEYVVDNGTVEFLKQDLLDLAPDERAREGLFMAFQYPVEIPGVSNANFLKTALNETLTHRGKEKLDAMEFLHLVKERMKLVNMDEKLLSRSINEGFSGGEKKRNEIFQLAVLDPKLAILDETDSGLDIDALKVVANGINSIRRDDNAFVVVTHYQRLLNYIVPDKVHILFEGRIAASGDKQLAIRLEEEGYDWLRDEKREPVTA